MRPPVVRSDTQSIPSVCHMCQRRHNGECRRYSTWCFHCGQEGYFIREFPQLIGVETSVASLTTPTPKMSTQRSLGRGFPSRGASAAAGRGGRGRGRGSALGMQTETHTQARVYVLSQQDADVVIGIISILDHDAYTLVDPGATHSFASRPFLDRFQIETQPLEGRMRVSLPVGDPLFSDRVVRDSRVLIGGQEFPADIVALDMRDFDVVLGMDWLSRHRDTLDFYKKEVKLHRPGKLKVKFRGIRKELYSNMIFALAAQRMLRKGCQGYLAYVVETRKEGTLVDEIPVVREFPDVFSNDITGLPPEREVEFTIDLIPGTEPISIPPYRMAPAELRELKAQLEELLSDECLKHSYYTRVGLSFSHLFYINYIVFMVRSLIWCLVWMQVYWSEKSSCWKKVLEQWGSEQGSDCHVATSPRRDVATSRRQLEICTLSFKVRMVQKLGYREVRTKARNSRAE